MNRLVTTIIESLQTELSQWTINEYHAEHKNGLSLRIGNGMVLLHVERPTMPVLGAWDTYKLWKVIRQAAD